MVIIVYYVYLLELWEVYKALQLPGLCHPGACLKAQHTNIIAQFLYSCTELFHQFLFFFLAYLSQQFWLCLGCFFCCCWSCLLGCWTLAVPCKVAFDSMFKAAPLSSFPVNVHGFPLPWECSTCPCLWGFWIVHFGHPRLPVCMCWKQGLLVVLLLVRFNGLLIPSLVHHWQLLCVGEFDSFPLQVFLEYFG